jgi:hypothetical protein
LIIVPNVLSTSSFTKLTDSLNNLAYDFHFYLPYEFTHQQAWWMPNPYPPANYPYPYSWKYLEHTHDLNESDYSGSSSWVRWEEHFTKGIDFVTNSATHVLPTYGSWDNSTEMSYDNVEFYINSTPYPPENAGFENGSGTFPDGWTQWGNNEESYQAIWKTESIGNRYLSIPATGENNSRQIKPFSKKAIPLPASFSTITVAVRARGAYQKYGGGTGANLFGLDWYQQYTYDQTQMRKDIESFIQFGQNNNVPIMCLEFGVIMKAKDILCG